MWRLPRLPGMSRPSGSLSALWTNEYSGVSQITNAG
jgi:hypothetical protein